jgi:anti-sigma B factor antagonist
MLRTKQQGGQSIVEVEGTVDVTTAGDLSQALARLEEDSTDELVVDLTDASLLDSAALATLVVAQKRARRRHGDVVLAGIDGRTRRLLETTGLDRSFRVIATVNDT